MTMTQNEMLSRKWVISSSIFFTLGSFTSVISSIDIVHTDFSINNIGQMVGYFLYSFGYSVYLYAEYKNNKYYYVFSTVFFIIASFVFAFFSTYDTDYTLNDISTLVGNWIWLIGYICSYKGELLSPNKNSLNQLTIPILHHNLPI